MSERFRWKNDLKRNKALTIKQQGKAVCAWFEGKQVGRYNIMEKNV